MLALRLRRHACVYAHDSSRLAKVNDDKIEVPVWLPQDQFHPADRYMSISKNVWDPNISDADILKVRKTYYVSPCRAPYVPVPRSPFVNAHASAKYHIATDL